MDKKELLKKLEQQGFSKQTLNAFAKVRREDFVSGVEKMYVYEDQPLSIGYAQTISQPSCIVTMLEMLDLKKSQKVLEIGSGCGYVLALLSEIVGKSGFVYGIERIKELAESSRENLKNYSNVYVYCGNGAGGLLEHAPLDRILISAVLKEIPEQLKHQLKNDGIIVAPIEIQGTQILTKFKKQKNKFEKKQGIEVRFVPFIEEN